MYRYMRGVVLTPKILLLDMGIEATTRQPILAIRDKITLLPYTTPHCHLYLDRQSNM